MTELKPCPFCGGKVHLETDLAQTKDPVFCFICDNCGAIVYMDDLIDKNESIEAWNNRPSNWHTGTPTEKGWYLIAFNYEFEEGVRYTTDYFKDGKWAFPMVRDISKLRAWKRITPYEEANT